MEKNIKHAMEAEVILIEGFRDLSKSYLRVWACLRTLLIQGLGIGFMVLVSRFGVLRLEVKNLGEVYLVEDVRSTQKWRQTSSV